MRRELPRTAEQHEHLPLAFGDWSVRSMGFAENLFLYLHVVLEKLLG